MRWQSGSRGPSSPQSAWPSRTCSTGRASSIVPATLLEYLVAFWSERNEHMSARRCGTWLSSSCVPAVSSSQRTYAQRFREIGQQYEREDERTPQELHPLTLVAAHRGELERAREFAELSVRGAQRHAPG